MLNKILVIFISSLISGCYTNKVTIDNFDMTNPNKIVKSQNSKIDIISIPELETNQEIESFNFDNSNYNLINTNYNLNDYKTQIQNINLSELSKWAKDQMKDYKLPDNFLDNFLIEKYFQTKDLTALKIKSISLPSHSPLVKRFLYLIPIYDNKKVLKKLYVTIKGYVEE